jgi:hypothetical protein
VSTKQIAIDASAALKWRLRDEEATAQVRLSNALEKQLPWVKWIGDYRLDLVPTT